MTSKKWILIGLIVAGLILTWLLFRGCSPGNTHEGEKKSVDSMANYWKQRHKYDSLKIDSADKASAAKDVIISGLLAQIKVTRGRLTLSQARARDLANIIISPVDTPAKFKACDSLAVVVQGMEFQISGLNTLTDTLVNAYTQLGIIKDSEIQQLKESYALQGIDLQVVKAKYDGLYKDYTKSVKANKFNKTASRVLAAAVLVLGGALLIK
jgi:hypothetical protein